MLANDLGETMRQFARTMENQLDLRNEAENLNIFAKNFHGFKWVNFPKPIENYVAKNALVETYMEGVSIMHLINDTLPEEYYARVGENWPSLKNFKQKVNDYGAELAVKMIFIDNFIHGTLYSSLSTILSFNQFSL